MIKVDLNRAIEVAVRAHAGQVDKSGKPYTLHPLRVMLQMDNENEMIVAVLHDVLEDSPAALSGEDLPDELYDALVILTRRHHEPYMDYIARIAQNDLAHKVKLFDLLDNLRPIDPAYANEPNDTQRREKYHQAIDYLTRKE